MLLRFFVLLLIAGMAFAAPPKRKAPVKKTQAQVMVERAAPYVPMIRTKVKHYWPAKYPTPFTFLLAQIEQESLWNPYAKLQTSRELGRGFGQLTITAKFNAYEEVRQLEPDLRNWDYESDPFNPEKQVVGILAKNRLNFSKCAPLFDGDSNQFACTASAYNGGLGGVLADRRLCGNTDGCDMRTWWGNVEETSLKQKTALPGYGKPFFVINREYARFLVFDRREKYAACFKP